MVICRCLGNYAHRLKLRCTALHPAAGHPSITAAYHDSCLGFRRAYTLEAIPCFCGHRDDDMLFVDTVARRNEGMKGLVSCCPVVASVSEKD